MDAAVTNINEALMESIFRLFAVMRRGPKVSEGDSSMQIGGNPSAQIRILMMLTESDGISQRDMTTLLQLRPQSVSETLSKLENSGMVERRQNPNDKRISNVFLLPEGKKKAEEICCQMPDAAAMFLSPLSEEEKEQMLMMMNKLIGAADDEAEDY